MYKLLFLSFFASSFLSNAQKKIIIPVDTLKTANHANTEITTNSDNTVLPFKILYNFSQPKLADFTRIDISKLQFETFNSGGIDEVCVDIPFEITTDFHENSDFIFVMLYPITTWSILTADKVGNVKSSQGFFDESGIKTGIKQGNRDLRQPIHKKGRYYIRLIFKEIPRSEKIMSFFVGERRI